MKRKHKRYSKPKRPFEKGRIEEEAEIKKRFGLKNKKEIWKADAKIKNIRAASPFRSASEVSLRLDGAGITNQSPT